MRSLPKSPLYFLPEILFFLLFSLSSLAQENLCPSPLPGLLRDTSAIEKILEAQKVSNPQIVGQIESSNCTNPTLQRNKKSIALKKLLPIKIQIGDVLATNGQCEMTLKFEDQSVVTLGAYSQVTVDHFVYKEKNRSFEDTASHFTRGMLRGLSGLVHIDASPGERPFLKSPIATLGIRGTKFEVKSTQDARGKEILSVRVWEGVVWLTSVESRRSIEVSKGFQATAIGSLLLAPVLAP